MEELQSIDTKTLKAILYAIIDRIEFYELMEKTPNCNDCASLNVCEVAPDYGQQVRYNCHLYVRGE